MLGPPSVTLGCNACIVGEPFAENAMALYCITELYSYVILKVRAYELLFLLKLWACPLNKNHRIDIQRCATSNKMLVTLTRLDIREVDSDITITIRSRLLMAKS